MKSILAESQVLDPGRRLESSPWICSTLNKTLTVHWERAHVCAWISSLVGLLLRDETSWAPVPLLVNVVYPKWNDFKRRGSSDEVATGDLDRSLNYSTIQQRGHAHKPLPLFLFKAFQTEIFWGLVGETNQPTNQTNNHTHKKRTTQRNKKPQSHTQTNVEIRIPLSTFWLGFTLAFFQL